MANQTASDLIQKERNRLLYCRGDGIYTATLTADLTLTRVYEQWVHLNPNGTSRSVTLPAPDAEYTGDFQVIKNTGTAGNLYLKTSAGVLLAVVYPGQTVRVQHGASNYVVTDGFAAGSPLQGSLCKPGRYRLTWIAGQRGKPSLNADIQNAAEATREIADPDFEVLGTNGTSALSTFYAEGGILFTTAGADNDQMILVPHLDANQTAWTGVTWGTDQELVWECFIQTTAAITAEIIWAGLKLTNTPTVATDNDQVFFRYQNGVTSGDWVAQDSIGNTDVGTDTSVLVAVNTKYHLQIIIDNARIARFYINGSLVRTTSAALTDATDLIPYIGVQASGAAAAKSIRIHGQVIERNVA